MDSCVFTQAVQAQWWVTKDVTRKTGVQGCILIQILKFLFHIQVPALELRLSP